MSIEEWYAKTERDEERALRRKIAAKAALEMAGMFLAWALVALAGWLYLASTSSQWSAEADAAEEASER